MSEEHIEIGKIKPGPIRHEDLSPELIARAKAIFAIVGRFSSTPYEQFELNFMRDAHPEKEIRIWEIIALAYSTLSRRTDDEAKLSDFFLTLLKISMGAIKPPANFDEMPQELRSIFEAWIEAWDTLN